MATKGGKSSSSNASEHHRHLREPEAPLDDEELQSLYAWVDCIPLSRPKKSINRDFSDGVLVAEIVHHCFPELVEMHNYYSANASDKKLENWKLLNRKVFSKMNFELAEDVMKDLCSCKPGMIEKVLMMLQVKIKRAEYARGRNSDKPEADQHQMTPGRKDGRMFRAGKEDTKGSGFLQTKHQDKDIELEPKKKVKFRDERDKKGQRINEYGRVVNNTYLDNKGWNSGYYMTHWDFPFGIHDKKSPPKMSSKPATIPKKKQGPVFESEMVPRYILEQREQEVLSRDETIHILQAKIQKMEYLLQLKDTRIAELIDHVDHCEHIGYSHIHGSQHKPAAHSHGVHQGAQVHSVFYKPSLYS